MVVFYQVLLMLLAWVLGAMFTNLSLAHRDFRLRSSTGHTGAIRVKSQRMMRVLLVAIALLIFLTGWLSYHLV